MLFSGIHRVLSNPLAYSCMRAVIGGTKSSQIFVTTFIRPRTGDKILDIGCGPGDILEFLPSVDYYGFDVNEAYINSARTRYPDRGQFFCKKLSRDAIPGNNIFDIVLACGVFHHLTDNEAVEMFELSNTLLKPGGRLITLDGVYMQGQSYLAHLLLSIDRGKFVRSQEQYQTIARKYFTDIRVSIRSDLIRLPYTHIIIECKKNSGIS